jgi:uncharacterized repeat protein (TIGR03837 family)
MHKTWDLFCRVIDNHGDLGVCWRLARQLAAGGNTAVRLWVDDAAALAWMAPDGPPQGIEVLPWDAAAQATGVGEVVIEAFGCELPEAFVARMAARQPAPAWINLEYLSAEDYVERSHGLASPQFSGPGRGLKKHFFYPGFTPRTGGLLREPGLIESVEAFDAPAWLHTRGIERRPGERLVSLFAYPNPALPRLLELLGEQPTLLLACPGAAQQALPGLALPLGLRWLPLPYLAQDDYDRLLWACDLNCVRGEDSFVRAQWAGKPFLWHIYPQDDGAHHAKLEAFMTRAGLPEAWRAVWRGWNGMAPLPTSLSGLTAAAAHAPAWRARLAAQADLLTQLQAFLAAGQRSSAG